MHPAAPAALQGHTLRDVQAVPDQQTFSSLAEMRKPVVIGIGGVPVLHSHQECGKARLIQLQHAGEALPVYEVERQAGQRPATCRLQSSQGTPFTGIIITPWEGQNCSGSLF